MYIEREALLAHLHKSMPFACPPDFLDGLLDAIEQVKIQPAADVVPVVRGEWIRAAAYNDGVLNTAYCSVCKNYLPISNWDYHNFCPDCGARMKGEQS